MLMIATNRPVHSFVLFFCFILPYVYIFLMKFFLRLTYFIYFQSLGRRLHTFYIDCLQNIQSFTFKILKQDKWKSLACPGGHRCPQRSCHTLNGTKKLQKSRNFQTNIYSTTSSHAFQPAFTVVLNATF